MARVGFLGRLMLILMGALMAMIAINLAITHVSQRDRVQNVTARFPRVVHAAGLIALIRDAKPEMQRRIAQLSEAGIVRVAILDALPPPSSDDISAPHLAARMIEVLGMRPSGLEVFTNTRMKHPQAIHSRFEGQLTKVVVPLEGGRTLLVEWLDPPRIVSFTLLGLGPAIWAAILGFAVATLALIGASREMRPLRRLTEAVSHFDGKPMRVAFDESGAPDMRRLVRAVHDMQQRVATLLGERTFLVGAISHDLRIYLTRLRLRADAVADPEARERLIGDLDGMSSLIDSSLAFARAATSGDQLSRIDLGDLVAVEVEEHAAIRAEPRLEGTYADDAIVLGDPVALRRVVSNVLDNALKFARSAVTVRVDRTPTHERVTIVDDGPGIPEAERKMVFDPFYRAETRARGSGTGLGLAIARQIVEAHGGTIEVAAAPSRGAAFLIALPASRA